MMLVNLLPEIIDLLSLHGKTHKDVLWISNATDRLTWKQFERGCMFLPNAQNEAVIMVIGQTWYIEIDSNNKFQPVQYFDPALTLDYEKFLRRQELLPFADSVDFTAFLLNKC